jgi:hypothetical protein
MMRLQHEREGLIRQLDLEYLRINGDLEVEVVGRDGGEDDIGAVGGGGEAAGEAEAVGGGGEAVEDAGAVGGGAEAVEDELMLEPVLDDTGYITCVEY